MKGKLHHTLTYTEAKVSQDKMVANVFTDQRSDQVSHKQDLHCVQKCFSCIDFERDVLQNPGQDDDCQQQVTALSPMCGATGTHHRQYDD
jgi:hypothetical protein